MEVWKQIEDYPNYFVSNTGKVRNVNKGRELKQTLHHSGYLYVGLRKNQKTKLFFVHRLVAQAFIPNINNLNTVDHWNGIKTDNRVENLQWLSNSDNARRFQLEQITEEQKQRKMKPIICVETGIIYKSATEVSTMLGVRLSAVTAVARKERKTVKGFHFEYL